MRRRFFLRGGNLGDVAGIIIYGHIAGYVSAFGSAAVRPRFLLFLFPRRFIAGEFFCEMGRPLT